MQVAEAFWIGDRIQLSSIPPRGIHENAYVHLLPKAQDQQYAFRAMFSWILGNGEYIAIIDSARFWVSAGVAMPFPYVKFPSVRGLE